MTAINVQEFHVYGIATSPHVFEDWLKKDAVDIYPESYHRWKDLFVTRGTARHTDDLVIFKNSGDMIAFDYGIKGETNYSHLIEQRNDLFKRLVWD